MLYKLSCHDSEPDNDVDADKFKSFQCHPVGMRSYYLHLHNSNQMLLLLYCEIMIQSSNFWQSMKIDWSTEKNENKRLFLGAYLWPWTDVNTTKLNINECNIFVNLHNITL